MLVKQLMLSDNGFITAIKKYWKELLILYFVTCRNSAHIVWILFINHQLYDEMERVSPIIPYSTQDLTYSFGLSHKERFVITFKFFLISWATAWLDPRYP